MDFEARVHTVSQQLIPPQGNSGYPPMVVYYHCHAPVLLSEDGSPVHSYQPDPRMLKAVRKLASRRRKTDLSLKRPLRYCEPEALTASF
ncbi:MAG: hypothetical protein M3Z24_05305 [Chloroflexota bacterium]|nr:hypothetical protein [Chloroflexota bacterium]